MMARKHSPAIRFAILSIFILVSGSQSSAQPAEKKIALTFDKLPFMKPMGFWRPREISTMLLKALDEHSIKVAGFVVEEKVAEEPYSPILLNDWVTRGHLLGNQTWGDADFNVLSFDHFLEHLGTDRRRFESWHVVIASLIATFGFHNSTRATNPRSANACSSCCDAMTIRSPMSL